MVINDLRWCNRINKNFATFQVVVCAAAPIVQSHKSKFEIYIIFFLDSESLHLTCMLIKTYKLYLSLKKFLTVYD